MIVLYFLDLLFIIGQNTDFGWAAVEIKGAQCGIRIEPTAHFCRYPFLQENPLSQFQIKVNTAHFCILYKLWFFLACPQLSVKRETCHGEQH